MDTEVKRQRVVRVLRGLEKELENAPPDVLDTIFCTSSYLWRCLLEGQHPKDHPEAEKPEEDELTRKARKIMDEIEQEAREDLERNPPKGLRS